MSSSDSAMSISFIRTEFSIGYVTDKEAHTVLREVDMFMAQNCIAIMNTQNYVFGTWKMDKAIFNVSVIEHDDNMQEKLDKLLFKIKLRHPEFEIVNQPKLGVYS